MELLKLQILVLPVPARMLSNIFSSNFKDLNIGSPLYMAPEGILQNMYGPKTDVWAFGVLTYELYH